MELAKLSVGDNSKAIAATTDGNFEIVETTGGAAVTVNDKALAADQKLKTVKSNGNTGALTIGAANATDIQQLWLSNTDQSATVTANAGSRDLTVALDNVTGGTITDAQATGLALKSPGQASSGVTVYAAAATTVTLDAGADLDLASLAVDATETIAIKGGSKVTINAATVGALEVIDASDNRGGVTFTPAWRTTFSSSAAPGWT